MRMFTTMRKQGDIISILDSNYNKIAMILGEKF